MVLVSTAHGLKFPEFKVRYHEDQLQEYDVTPARANHPLEVDADFDQVRGAVLDSLEAAGSVPAGAS